MRFFKIYIITFLLLICCVNAKAQPYGNEWINYSQKYYYFPLYQEGIYRLTYDSLLASGIPVNNIDPRNIQIFSRGVEIPLYIEGEKDGIFDNSDFIEFYGRANDGFLDSLLYENPGSQPHGYYSLFNDTISYYLTWNNSTDNKRLIPEAAVNFGSYNKSPFFYKEIINLENSSYYRGATITTKNTDPLYNVSEGWFGPVINYDTKVTRSFNTSNLYSEGPFATFKTVFIGQSNYEENPDHRISVEFKNKSNVFNLLLDTLFDGYKQIKFSSPIVSSQLHPSQTDFRYSSLFESNITGNRTAIAYSSLKFPHTFNFENQNSYRLIIPDDDQGKTYMEANNFVASGKVHLYDITNSKRISVVSASGVHRALIPNAGGEKICYLTSESYIKLIGSIKPVSENAFFQNYENLSADFLIVSNKKLQEGADAYAAYRKSKGAQALVIYESDLYHQFAYGINKNPLALRRFCDLALDKWSVKPKHLFLIGKALYADTYRNNTSYYSQTLVPSYGVPPCDILITAGLNGTLFEPAIPTGRLAVRTNEEIMTYLSKVMEFETDYSPLAEWKKNVLFFGGGVSLQEQATLSGYLNGYKETIQDTLFGASVHTFLKTSTAPVQITVSDSIRSLLNNGTSLINFFAHGTATTFDISTDDPSNYNNKGKYPIFIANACYSGDIHLPAYNSTSEKQVLIPDKGGIAFLATIQDGYPPFLDLYTKELYKNISYKLYGRSFGEMMQMTIKNIQDPKNVYIRDVCLYTTLHGDPAICLNKENKADLSIKESAVFFNPSEVTTQSDSMQINIELTNLGKSVLDSFNILVVRMKPNSAVDSAFIWVNKIIYKDTVSCFFKLTNSDEAGINVFDIHVDYLNQINEVSKINNKTSVILNIKSNDIIPVYPPNFAIVSNQGISLKAGTGNPLSPIRNYIFEVDTTDLFNSPLRERALVTGSGALISWKPQLLSQMSDSMVYFWRVSLDSTQQNALNWHESSFHYIPQKKGWSQSHFFQFESNQYDLLSYDRAERLFNFESSVKEVLCRTPGEGAWYGQLTIPPMEWKIDAASQEAYSCTGAPPMLMVGVMDSLTLNAWGTKWLDRNTGILYNPNHDFGNINNMGGCKDRIQKYFMFTIDESGINGLTNMLKKIPKGNYVLVYCFRQNGCQVWDNYNTELHDILEQMGAQGLRDLPEYYPFAFLAKKGYPNTASQQLGKAYNDVVNFSAKVYNKFPKGELTSSLIGPARKWHELHASWLSVEKTSYDKISFKLYGVRINGTSDLLADIKKEELPLTNLSAYADAAVYPFLKIKAFLADDSLQSPPQLKSWKVLYDEVPELTLNTSKYYEFSSDSVQEGQHVKIKVGVLNISETTIDSAYFKYSIEDANRKKQVLSYQKIASILPDSTALSEIEFNTTGFGGINKVWLEYNPSDVNWTPEQNHFNNVMDLNLRVEKDMVNPLLDVTFDGKHIMNGEIVSSKPLIMIQLNDENKYLAMNDTADFSVFIKDPLGNQRRIGFANESRSEKLRFYPAVLPDNRCKIAYDASFENDGVYELRVQAKDQSNNASGTFDYVIKFEVINKSTISQVLNYPNPFANATKFVFTLTGSQLPDDFRIQIMTITGKVIREINQAELGPIRIGKNITEYAWDGRDDYGDLLANGIYLYRVICKINNSDIEKLEGKADKYFNHEFGKMYLMR